MAHAQKPDFVFRRNGRVHLNRRGRQFSPLLAAEVCVSAVVMLDTPCSDVVWRVLATHSIRQFPLCFPSRASPCAITFQLEFTYSECVSVALIIQHAMRMRRNILSRVSCLAVQYYTTLFHKPHNLQKSVTENKNVSWFSLQSLSKIFLIR